MTGAEHYRVAERLIANDAGPINPALAQVHATLALAAATALPQSGDMYYVDRHDWELAASANERVPAA